MVSPPKLLRGRAGIGRFRCRTWSCAEGSAHVLAVGLGLFTEIVRLYCRCLIESRKPSSHTWPHQRAMTAVINAAAQPRQKAVDHSQPFARLDPIPMRNPIIAHKTIKDFIPDLLLSRIVASKCPAAQFVQNLNVYRWLF